MELRETPLSSIHEEMGARMVEFAGFRMPVSYSSIIEEHHNVRRHVGLFDVSHMGEFLVEGPQAGEFTNRLVTNDCSKLTPGRVLYTVMCREDGTSVDDLLVYLLNDARAPRYLFVVNAANIDKDFSHASSIKPKGTSLIDMSEETALLAVQGPSSRDTLKACRLFEPIRDELDRLGYYRFIRFGLGGDEITVSRTGYTGELGFEVFVPPRRAREFWEAIMEAGETYRIRPIGLAARDTLRFEASFCLYGHELDDATTPLEAGLAWVVKFDKGDFVGRSALLEEMEAGPRRMLIGLELEGKRIARQGFPVLFEGAEQGRVTSGTFSPTLGKSLAMAMVGSGCSDWAVGFEVDVRGERTPAARVELPFYRSRARD